MRELLMIAVALGIIAITYLIVKAGKRLMRELRDAREYDDPNMEM